MLSHLKNPRATKIEGENPWLQEFKIDYVNFERRMDFCPGFLDEGKKNFFAAGALFFGQAKKMKQSYINTNDV